MSQRYPPTHDSRYAPRDRSRSPPFRFQDRRASAPFNPPFSGRNPPLGPRGRGSSFYPDGPDNRNGPPLGPPRDRPFRDREFDRRPRPPSPPPPQRPRSPTRNFRDAPSPRELDTTWARRESRDAPFSAGPSFADQSSFSNPPFPRGGFGGGRGRGRGRGDFDFRDRARRPPPQFEDRNVFRPRERSPPPPTSGPSIQQQPSLPPRWSRDESRDSREDWRANERLDEDRWSDREPRDREPNWYRREQIPPSRFDSRPEISSRPPTPQQATASHPERGSIETARDGNDSRRSSSSLFPPAPKDARQEPAPKNDLLAGRAEASINRAAGRSSPPPQAPSVPAFGSVSFKAPAQNAAPPNLWRPAPQETRQPPSPVVQPRRAPSPVLKVAPTGPRNQSVVPTPQVSPGFTKPPPEAPRAPRALEAPPVPSFREAQSAYKSQDTVPPSIPTGPAAFRGERPPQPPTAPQPRDWMPPGQVPPSAPKSQQSQWQGPPVARNIRGASAESAQSLGTTTNERRPPFVPPGGETRSSRADLNSFNHEASPPVAPSGPKANMAQSASPQMTSSGIPTAPRADRVPPAGPRAGAERGPVPTPNRPTERPAQPVSRAPPNAPRGPGPAWNQWRAPNMRDAVVPVKRDANGDEKEGSNRAFQSLQQTTQDLSRVPSREETTTNTTPKPQSVSGIGRASEHVSQVKSEATLAKDNFDVSTGLDDIGDPVEAPESDESSEDDGMDLDDHDFEATKHKYEQEKAQLESQLVDLSDRQYRATTPLEQLARLAKITVHDIPSSDELLSMTDAPELEDEEEDVSRVVSPRGSVAPDEIVDQDLLTPKEEEAEDVVMDDNDAFELVLPPSRRRRSPEVINLPYLTRAPESPQSVLKENMKKQEETRTAVMAHLRALQDEADALESDLSNDYFETYRVFRDLTRRYDEDRQEKERQERQKSADTGPDLDSSMYALAETPTTERSQRLHKFSSEYDIQKVLKESEEMARLEQERQDREAQKTRDSLEKEAVPPHMWDEELQRRRLFKNTNSLREPWHLPDIYGYEPPSDDFTPEEHRKFLETFRERPKKWGEIAAVLPGRTYQHCIHHYYSFKWDGRFRETKGKRKPRIGRGRGGKISTRVRGAALMADLGRTEDDTLGAGAANVEGGTGSSRPRRAAASRTANQEKDNEAKANSATPAKRITKMESSGEPGAEKIIKRRKAATGEKVSRKTKTQQPLAAALPGPAGPAGPVAPVGSPIKNDKEVQFRANELSAESLARVEEARLLAGLQAGPDRPRPGTIPVYHSEAFFPSAIPPEPLERPRAVTQSSQSRQAASSYWSVPEVQDFNKFLGHFGTDFAAIANHMGTKTQTMVKNYYQRHCDSGSRQDLIDVAEGANARRARGEDMGVPPVPTPIIKRRYDNPQTTNRVLAPNGEGTEVDEATMAAAAALSSQARFPSTASSTPIQQRVVPTPVPAPSQPSQSTAPPKAAPSTVRQPAAPGPKMGFFTESRTEQRPTVNPFVPSRPMPQPHQPTAQQQAQQQQVQMQRRPSQEARDAHSNLIQKLKQEQERALNLQREQEQRTSQEHVPQLPQHHPLVYPNIPPSSARQVEISRREEQIPAQPSSGAQSRPGPNALRNIMGSSPMPAQSVIPSLPAPMHAPQHPSPPKTHGFRPSSVPAVTPAAPPPSKPATPAEPTKRSNLASLLNSEPEEPRPMKRMSEQSVHGMNRAQSPANIPRNPTPSSQPIFSQPRRDTISSQTSAPRPIFDRPGQTTPAPTPPPQRHESSLWSNLARSREDWNARSSIGQPAPTSSSPNPMQADRDRLFSHRGSAFGPLGGPMRGNPSPPPHGHSFPGHSRTPSYSQATPPQQHPSIAGQGMQMQSREAGPGNSTSILQPNPYAQPPGPASHLQQLQAQQQQQQNQMHHMHNMNVHSRQGSREDDIAAQQERVYRERLEMERNMRDREAAFAADQARYNQQRQRPGPPQPMHASMHQGPPMHQPMQGHYHHGPPPPVPSEQRLSLREQAEREGMAGYREAQFRLDRERMEAQQQQQQQQQRQEEEVMMRRQREEDEYRQGIYGRAPSGGFGGFPPPPSQRRR